MNSPQFEVTAVVAAYNAEKFLARSIASIVEQTHRPHEIIVVDDASTDSSVRVADEALRGAPNGRVMRLSENVGPSGARRKAVADVTTPWVAFLDADDVWTPEHLALLARAHEARPDVDVLFTFAEDMPTGITKIRRDIAAELISDTLATLIADNIVTQSAVALRRSAMDAVGGYHPTRRLSEDFDLWLRLAESRHTFARVPAVTCYREAHAEQATVRNRARLLQEGWRLREKVFNRLSEAERARMRSHFLQALEADVRSGWYARDRGCITTVDATSRWLRPRPMLLEWAFRTSSSEVGWSCLYSIGRLYRAVRRRSIPSLPALPELSASTPANDRAHH